MSLASNYATLLKTLDVKKVLAYMKQKGHLSLLPQVTRLLKRERVEGETVIVAHEKDAQKHLRSDLRVIVDPSIVGGFIHRKGSKLVDNSYRKALVEIYKNAVK